MNFKKPRKRIYQILDSASHMKGVLNAVNEGVITFDSELKIIMANRFALNLWGYSREEILGKNLSILIDKPYSNRIIKYAKDNNLSDKLNILNKNLEIHGLTKNKKKFPISLNFVENKTKDTQFFTVAITDLTSFFKNKLIQNCMLEISNSVRVSTNIEQLYKDIYKNLSLLMPIEEFSISLISDKNTIKEYNYISKIKNFESNHKIKSNIIEPIIKNSKPLIYCFEEIEYLKEKGKLNNDFDSPNSFIGCPLIIAKEIIGVVSVKSFDSKITYSENELNILKFISDQIALAIDKVKSVEEMHYLAYYDKMTNLPNRILFNDRAKLAFKNAKRNKDKYAVLFLDLDEFKLINDTMGHSAGDKLLKIIAKKLRNSVREGDTISHWGGDEFTILSKINDVNDNKILCQRILKEIKKSVKINKKDIECSVSIGTSIYPTDGQKIDELIQKADMAMYVSKTKGKDSFTLFNNKINEKMVEKLNLEVEMRKIQNS